MTPRRLAVLFTLAGGVVWLVGAAVGWGDEPVTGLSRTLWFAGLVLLFVATGIVGHLLVRGAPVWLRAVVTVGAAALAVTVAVAPAPDVEIDAVGMLVEGVLLTAIGVAGAVSTRR